MMKKLQCLLILSVSTLALTACDKGDNTSSSSRAPAPAQSAPPAPENDGTSININTEDGSLSFENKEGGNSTSITVKD